MDHPQGYSGFPGVNTQEEPQVPGRRTPLGTMSLGGFYFQGQQNMTTAHGPPSDENNPDPECSPQGNSR